MPIQAKLLGLTSLLALGFVVYLMIGLANFEGHRSRIVKPEKKGKEAPATGSPQPKKRPSRGPTEPDEVAAVNLRRLLLKLTRTPQPALREKIFERARARIDEFEPRILDLLADDSDSLLLPAIDLVEALPLPSAALSLVTLANADQPLVRAAAIRVKETLDSWGDNDLQMFLRQEKHPVVLETALVVLARRGHRPIPEIMALLQHDEARVRNAAAAAIPELAPGPQLDAMCELARKAKGRAAQAFAEALGSTLVPEPAERCLLEMLANEDRLVRMAALQALQRKKGELVDLEPLFASIQNDELRMHERVLGFGAMERTKTIPVDRIKGLLPGLNPMLKLYAARCLYAARDAAAIGILIDLLDTVESETVTFNEFLCATTEARMILKEIAGEDLGKASEPWRQWHRKVPAIRWETLKRPAPTFW